MKKIFEAIFILFLLTLLAGCASSQLHVMAKKGDVKAVSALLDNGADVNAKDTGIECPGWTPLHWAAYRNHADVALLLIERGADLNAKGHRNFRTWTPLQLAENEGATMVARILREAEYEFLERLANKHKQQPPRYRASPPTLPTALPLPMESDAPF